REDLGRRHPRPRDRPSLSRAGRRKAMRTVVLTAAAALALSCGGGSKPLRAGGAPDATPSWLSEGTGAIRAEGGRKLQGVGVASAGCRGGGGRRESAPGCGRRRAGAAGDVRECRSGVRAGRASAVTASDQTPSTPRVFL